MKDWSEKAARQWLYDSGMDHIEDGLLEDGAQLIFYSKFYSSVIDEYKFKEILKKTLGYDDLILEDCLNEVRELKLSAFS